MLFNFNKKNRLSLTLVGLLTLFSASLAAQTPLTAPQLIIQETSKNLQSLMQKEGDALKDIHRVREVVAQFIEPNVDFHRISSAIVGRQHWRSATKEQKERFKHEFKEKLIRTYATAFNSFNEWSIRFLPLRQSKSKKYVTVKTQILRPGGAPAVSVDYKMYEKKGQWKIFDVSIEGISVVTNYQRTIKREIRQAKGSLEAVIQKLAKKNSQPITVVKKS
jgi:phospholipid transport system substrate-binding protein